MTDKQDPIAHAARLLREAAEELRQAHAYNNSEGWENETDAKAAYDEHLAAAQALEDWEAAVGAGGVSGPLMGIAAPPTAQALGCGAEPPGIQALMCVISSLRDIAHFSDEEGGELMSALCALRNWAYAQTAAFQPPPTSAEGVEHGYCTFDLAWRGQCKATCEGSVCTQHAAVKCCVCGEQATHECDHTGHFVCGAPLCNKCEGHTDTSKPAGGWGFMNHTHRQKDPS